MEKKLHCAITIVLINFQAHIFSREKEQIREKKGETTIDIISDIIQIVGEEQKIRFFNNNECETTGV